MSDISGIDGSKFLVDPRSSNEVIMGRLQHYPEFKEPLPFNKHATFRYIILMYDINNVEIQGLYPDYMTRKRSCAVMAGFTVTKNRFSKDVEDALLGRNMEVNKMIIRYVRMFNNPEYVSYVSYWEMLIRNVELSMGEDEPRVITTIRQNIDNLRSQIGEITKNIFRGDDNENLRKQLYASMEEEKLKLRPEYMARVLQDKDLEFSETADVHRTVSRNAK